MNGPGPESGEADSTSHIDPRGVDSPRPLAEDPRLNTARILPSWSNAQVAAASELIGGPVGRHAAVGRSRRWTPVRVVFLMALAVLALSWFGKAGCLQQAPAPAKDGESSSGMRLNWDNQRQYYGLCYSDVIAMYSAQRLTVEDLRHGAMPYRTYWSGSDEAGEQGQKHYADQPVLIGAFMYLVAKAAQGWQALIDGTPIPKQLDVVTFFNIAALLLTLFWLLAVWATMMTDRRRLWIGATAAISPLVLFHGFTAFDVIPVALVAVAMLCWARDRVIATGVFAGLAAAAALYPLLLIPALAVLCARDRRMNDFAAVVASAVIAWLALNLPVILAYPHGWGEFYRTWWDRRPEADSLYHLIMTATGWSPPTTLFNALVLVLTAAVIAAAAYVALRSPAPSSPQMFAQVMFLLVVGCLVFSKTWNPQSSLWLVPLAVLAIPHARLLLAWMAVDALVWVPRMGLFLDPSRKWLPEEWFYVTVAVRTVLLLVLCGLVVRDLLAKPVTPGSEPPLLEPDHGGVGPDGALSNGVLPAAPGAGCSRCRWSRGRDVESARIRSVTSGSTWARSCVTGRLFGPLVLLVLLARLGPARP
ncbi:MAG: glycosyltransferase 87 family protein [Gordonia sp. (in: high G+C Gram-positive bacteria)]|uniref:glycosyltransferase family 87 protein n=1 Tax=Gordonia sp. (in: high G+C Gram-positive bacteria) TaxID=84139 RepID=UPI0039E5CCB9